MTEATHAAAGCGAGDAGALAVPADPITVTINGKPEPKGRPRFYQGRVITPPKTVQYERKVASETRRVFGTRPMLAGPIHAGVLVYLPIPASWSKKKKAAALAGEIRPTSRPDIDNYLKAALDAMNGIAFDDDAQVVELGRTAKFYSENPRLVVTLRQVLL